MTETTGTTSGGTPTYPPSTPPESGTQTRDVAKDEARGVAQDAVQSGKQTAETAKEQAGQVAGEAMGQARMLFDQTREQVTTQGAAQKDRAASGLHSLADDLRGMVDGTGGQSGLASELATQAAERIREAAQFLENREPGDLLDEVRRFARRRPGAFLLGAAAAGFVGGRLTRGLTADSGSDDSSTALASGTGYTATGYTGTGYTGTDYTGAPDAGVGYAGVPAGDLDATGADTRNLTTAPGAASLSGTPASDTIPPSRDWDRPPGGDAALTGYGVPPEDAPVRDPNADETATFNPAPQTGGPAEDRI